MTQDELRSAQVTSKLTGVIDVGSRVRVKSGPTSSIPATVVRQVDSMTDTRLWCIRYDDDGMTDEWPIAESKLELI